MLKSFVKNKKGIVIMFLSSVCVCVGQLLWKLSVNQGIIVMIMGFCIYGAGAMLMVFAYRFGKLSVLQPMLSMNYVLSILLASFVLKEKISILKCIGIFFITLGVLMIAGGDEE